MYTDNGESIVVGHYFLFVNLKSLKWINVLKQPPR